MFALLLLPAGDGRVRKGNHLSLAAAGFDRGDLADIGRCDGENFCCHDVAASDENFRFSRRISLIGPVRVKAQIRRQGTVGRDGQGDVQRFAARPRDRQIQVHDFVLPLIGWRCRLERARLAFGGQARPVVVLQCSVNFARQFVVQDEMRPVLPEFPSLGRLNRGDDGGGRARVQRGDLDQVPAGPGAVFGQSDFWDQMGAFQRLFRSACRSVGRIPRPKRGEHCDDRARLGNPELHAFVLSSAGRVGRRVECGDPACDKSCRKAQGLSMAHSLAVPFSQKDAA